MIIAEGKTTYITKLERAHVDQMHLWGRHTDPLFRTYNFPRMSLQEREYWHYQKTKTMSRKSYSVFNKHHELVGYISLRDIKWIRRRSELGIVFDPVKLNLGYGTDSLRTFLTYYFGEMGMSHIVLQVAAFNVRAQRCYANCQFRQVQTLYSDFEDQALPVFRSEQLAPYRQYFRVEGGKLKCRYLQMELAKNQFR